jgi:hypothetical protein
MEFQIPAIMLPGSLVALDNSSKKSALKTNQFSHPTVLNIELRDRRVRQQVERMKECREWLLLAIGGSTFVVRRVG